MYLYLKCIYLFLFILYKTKLVYTEVFLVTYPGTGPGIPCQVVQQAFGLASRRNPKQDQHQAHDTGAHEGEWNGLQSISPCHNHRGHSASQRAGQRRHLSTLPHRVCC